MKTYFYFLISFLILNASQANAQDQIYTVNNWSSPLGVSHHTVDPTNANVTTIATYGPSNLTSSALGMSSAGYLYTIPIVANTGAFDVYSINSSTGVVSTSPVLTGSVGSGSEVYFRRLGIAPDGTAYMISMSPGGSAIYFSKFSTDASGGASNFQDIGTITLSDGASASNFFNGDLAFDGNGTMFVLVNEDEQNGTTKIYQASASTVLAATNSSSVTELTYKATVLVPGGTNFVGAVTGLAFASNGNLYLSAQDPTDIVNGTLGLFLISKENTTGNIIATRGNYSTNNGLGDIASAYYPSANILPVNYNFIKARIVNNELQISWETSSEKNNQRFDVEVSKDGTNFTKIGAVNSKALNGISTRDIGYTFAASMNNVKGVVGLSMLAFALIGLPLTSRRSRLVLMACMVLGMGMFAASCSKSQDQIEVGNNSEKIFVRLVQYDIDGKKEVSEIKTAYKAD